VKKPSIEHLRECFELRQNVLHWRTRPAHHFVTKTGHAIFNGGNAGDIVRPCTDKDGYLRVQLTLFGVKHRICLHHVVWALSTGSWPAVELDHRDLNRTNCAFGNLREATHAQNNQNVGPYRNNKLGFKGVTVKRNRFAARIRANGVDHSLGSFTTAAAASEAYKAAALKLHGEFARFEK
jgi:hypothetical protein